MSVQDIFRVCLGTSIAQMCKAQGWTTITPSAKEMLVDLLEREMERIGKLTHKVTELYGRTESNLDDLGLAFELDKIDIGELQNYVQNADQAAFPHEPIAFPAWKADNLQIPKPNSLEILHHREEHIHNHLPPMFPSMEESGEQHQSSTMPPTPRENGLETATPNGTALPATAENRPVPSSLDPLLPGKRSRITPFSLPEEARPSQYEMSSVIMASDGTILGLNGRGKLPDPGPPPPTIRLGVSEQENSSNTSKRVEGSETNTDADTSSKEAAVRNSTATGKEGSAAGSGGSGNKSKSESSKAKSKKKEKAGLDIKEKKSKKTDKESDKKLKVTVGKRPVSGEHGSAPPPKKPRLKDVKTPDGKSKNSVKVAKIKEKAESKKKSSSVGKSFSSSKMNENGPESCLKDLLLSPDNLAPATHPEKALSASSGARKSDLASTVPADSDMLRQAFLPTDKFDSGSGETSPQRLVINEAEGRAQEKEEEKRIRLKNIDDTISSVIKDAAENFNSEKQESQTVENSVPPVYPAEPPRKRGRPKKIKAKDKIKSSEFIADDVISQEKAEEMGARSMKSITDTIDAVIRQGSEEPNHPLPKLDRVESSSISPVLSVPPKPDLSRPRVKERRKRKAEKDKAPAVKKKLKAKLQHKTEKDSELAPLQTVVDSKPSVSDKFSKAEMDVFDFGESESPPPIPGRRPSQAEKEPSPSEASSMSVPVTLSGIKGISMSADAKPMMKSPTPETAAVPVSSISSPPATSGDQQPLLPLKIGIPREKERERHREKSKDKEHHRKDKKEKRRDKEKKKKSRDRSRDKERRNKYRYERRKSGDDLSSLEGLKLKIKFGKESSLQTSMVVTDSQTQRDTESAGKLEVEHPSSNQHEVLKLVIRQDTAEGTSSQKKYSSMVSTPVHKPLAPTPKSRSEPHNSPPILHPPSPLPESPPLPVLSPEGERSRSPPAHSPPAVAVAGGSPSGHKSPSGHGHQGFSFASLQSSPQRGRPSLSPSPRTPSFSPKSSSPVPKTPPTPKTFGYPSSPISFSSPFHPSPVGHKSPTPTPKTPSLSPAYRHNSPDQADLPSLRQEKFSGPIRPLFGSPKRDTSPPSPLAPDPPVAIKPVQTDTPLPPVVPKPKGKVGRPRLNPPKTPAAKRKPPKSAGKAPKTVKAGGTGKSAGRGRPPKAKNLALMAALVGKSSESSAVKPNPKPLTPPSLEIKKDLQKTPASGLDVEVDKSGQDSSSESPSPTQLSVAFPASSSKQRGTVETETVGSFFDSETGVQVWYCPSCKQQDDGTPMIGCDKCDDWHHWVCVNITKEPPEEESWFCPRCSSSRGKRPTTKGKRGRKKKIH